ncbi:MAG: aryl-sulfate sulfotransferase [Rhizomicrobium sp.]
MAFAKFASLALAAGLFMTTAASASPSVYPTGTTIYDPGKAYNSFVAFAAPDGKTRLIDLDGHVVHVWNYWGFPSELINPAINDGKKGELVVQLSHTDGPQAALFGYIFANKTIAQVDWNGKVLWQWGDKAPGGAARQNHDWDHLPNGDTLIVGTVDRIVPSLSSAKVADQVFYEITPKGQIVWKWYVADHINEFGLSPDGLAQLKAFLAPGSKGHGFITINDMQPIGPNKWFDAGDKRFAPDNIVIDSREASFIAIIDKKSGKIVWRLGPDYPTNQSPVLRPVLSLNVPRPVDQTSGQHDAHIISKGLPGAGDLLVFDNEGPSGYPPMRLSTLTGSRVLEINPITKQIVWQYSGIDSGSPAWSFFSSFISSARRLPNGNTLIDEGMNGRLFQVTPKGEIVWEYVNPYFARQLVGPGPALKTNWVFRAQPVPYNWVPDGTPHSQTPVRSVDVSTFHVSE